MIIQEINATVNGNSLSGEVIVPSPVLTATKQSEDGNLTKSPNFKLKLTGVTPVMNIIDTVQVEFTNGDFNYTANMTVINSQQNGTVTLQYVDGLTVEEVEHTFECAATDIQTSYDLISGDDKVGGTHFLYDGVAVPAADISFGTLNYHNITVGEPTANDITLTPKTTFPEMSTGEFVDTLTATYKGMTTTVNVVLTITKENLVIPDNTFFGELTAEMYDVTLNYETITLDSYITAKNNGNLILRTKNMTFDGEKFNFEAGNDNILYYELYDGNCFESLRFVELTPEYVQIFLQKGRYNNGSFSQDGDDLIWTIDDVMNEQFLGMVFTDAMNQVGENISCKMITVTEKERPTEPTGPHFSSPVDGDNITGTIDSELGEFKYPIEVVGSDGNNISYDITAVSVTCDNQDVAVGYTEDADENDMSYISGVYIYIYQAGSGTATLTYDNADTGETCTATFTYDISEGGSDATT